MSSQEKEGNAANDDSSGTAKIAPASKVPEWLKSELFEDVLKNTVIGYRKIKNFKAAAGIDPGENYSTIMLRVDIEVELEDNKSKSVSYMLKLPHQDEIYQKWMEKINAFHYESEMYNDIVPELEQLYRDVGVELQFGAKSYTIEAPTDYVLLEDLRPRGFKNANRLEGLDVAHTQCVLRKLAQFHAASAVRVATKGIYSPKITIGFFKEELKSLATDLNESRGQTFIKCCQTYEGSDEYIEQVKSVQAHIVEDIYKMAKIDPNEFNVLNHGDCWSNNIMFQYDAFGKVKETYLVDYQLPKYGTVAQDLQYFLLSSTKIEDKVSKFDYYIKYYHDCLVEHLQILKYSKPMPTLRDIHMALLKYGSYGYYTISFVLSIVLMDKKDGASLDKLVGDSTEAADFNTSMYINAPFRKQMEAILPWLLNRGALESNHKNTD